MPKVQVNAGDSLASVWFCERACRFALEVNAAGRYGAALSSTQFNNETVVALYRFAFLLEGDGRAAEQTLVDALTECAPQIEQIRNEKNRIVFLVRKLRESCLK